MAIVIHNAKTNKYYTMQELTWPSFCNGQIITFTPIKQDQMGSFQHNNESYQGIADIRDHVRHRLVKGYVLVPERGAKILQRAGKVFDDYERVRYTANGEGWELWTPIKKLNKLISDVPDTDVRRVILTDVKSLQKYLDIPKPDADYVYSILQAAKIGKGDAIKLTPSAALKYFNGRGNGIWQACVYLPTRVMIPGETYPLLATSTRPNNLVVPFAGKLTAKNQWGELMGTQVSASFLFDSVETLLTSFLETLKQRLGDGVKSYYDGSVANSRDYHSGIIWLSDNLHGVNNKGSLRTSVCTGTLINLMKERQLSGDNTIVGLDGKPWYFHVDERVVANANHGNHDTFVAAISPHPLKVTRVK